MIKRLWIVLFSMTLIAIGYSYYLLNNANLGLSPSYAEGSVQLLSLQHAFLLFTTLLINGGIYWGAKFASKPENIRWVNIPYRSFWVETSAKQTVALSRLSSFMGVTHILVNALLFGIALTGLYPGPLMIAVSGVLGVTLGGSVLFLMWRNFHPNSYRPE